jgi:TrmH family RNA methyltransferase
VKSIHSSGNPRYKALRRLVESSQERKRSGLSVLDGAHLVAACLEHRGLPEQVIVSRSGAENPEIRGLLARMGRTEVLLLGDALFKSLSSVVTPTGILALVRTPRQSNLPGDMDACVMLEDLQDPGNLGSILRSCAAAGVRHVLLSPGSVHAWSPRVLRAAMGAHFALGIYEQVDLRAAARMFSGTVIATKQRASQSVFDAALGGKVAFLFGNEGAGLSAALLQVAHAAVSIPMAGTAESLNVAAAAAVCLFERVRQLSVVSRQPSAERSR